jgi:predicted peptidase
MGTKDPNCADSLCGAWMDVREYFVRLPIGYDPTKAYPLLLEGPGCGGHGNNLYNVPAFNSSLIRVGLSPSVYWQAFHSTNPQQGCFDDKEGDDSVDFVFYEALWDQLASTVCFDRNRVFAGGNSTGATLANELGCKYAGDAKHPIRGVLANTGGLPTDPMYVPTCTTTPMAGFWSHQLGDYTTPFTGSIVAMNRALTVDGCAPPGVTYATAMFAPFPLPGLPDGTCKKYLGCPDAFPLVVCPVPGNLHSTNDNVVVPGWPAFLASFGIFP